jgi:pSer/pThr/pTyr-binding forkhead associated (FHA) protein
VRIGAAALNRGVLLGRYFRCDAPTALFDQSVSRVHAMLLRHHGRVYLVDAGSTYGIWVGRRPVKCAVLVEHENYTLSATTVLRWNRLQRRNETRSA